LGGAFQRQLIGGGNRLAGGALEQSGQNESAFGARGCSRRYVCVGHGRGFGLLITTDEVAQPGSLIAIGASGHDKHCHR
jgi:hypothetical protein